MKFNITIISVLLLNFISAQEITDVVYTSSTADNLGSSVHISESKSIYSMGEFWGDLSLGSHSVIANTNQTVFFSKQNSNGDVAWLNSIKGTRNVYATKILTKDNLLIIGGGYSDSLFIGSDTLVNSFQKGIFIGVYDTLGTYQYSINPNCASGKLTDFTLTDNNELLMTGTFFNEFTFAGQDYDSPLGTNFYVLSYNLSNQSENWFRHSTGSNTNANKIRIDSNENIIIVGSYGQNVFIETTALLDNGTEHNTYVAKFSSSGTFLWVEEIIGLDQIHGFGLAIGDNDDIFICGEFEMSVSVPDGSTLSTEGLMDGLVYKYNSGGNYQWSKQIGGIDNDTAIDIVLDINGNPIVLLNAGRGVSLAATTMNPNGFNEPLVIKLNKFDGSHIWHKRIPALDLSGVVLSNSMAIQDSLICVTGKNFTGIEFNNNVIVSSNIHDYFLVLIDDNDYAEYLSTEELNSNSISVYPNPFDSELNFSSGNEMKQIAIYDMSGKLVYSTVTNTTHKTIIPNLNSGSYILKVETENTITTTKITHL